MCVVVWYYIAIGIAAAVIIKLAIPYIRRRYVDNDGAVACPVCGNRYTRNEGPCPKCGVGGR